jgi:hypothetical protein
MLDSELLGWGRGANIWFESCALWAKEKTERHFANEISNTVPVLKGGGAVDELVMLGQDCLPSNYHTHVSCR